MVSSHRHPSEGLPLPKIRVGIIGGGRIADLNVLGWLEHPEAEVAAVCDTNPETLKRRAEQWGATPYADPAYLLSDPSIDAVEILTPHFLHVDQAIAALEAGKHV